MPTLPLKQHGFSIIELLVGLGIGVIGLMVVSQAFVMSDQQKKATSGGADAQTSGVLASFLVERDLRQAGYGLSNGPALGCTAVYVDTQNAAAGNQTLEMVPIKIVQGADANTPDTLTVVYSGSEQRIVPATLSRSNNGTNANYQVENRYGFCPGDVTLVAQTGQQYCIIAQITNVPGTPGQTDVIVHNPGQFGSDCGEGDNLDSQYNPSGGVKVNGATIPYASGASLYNMGGLPINNVYTVSNNQLARNGSPIAENVINLKARYGRDDNGDGTVDVYDNSTPVDGPGWQKIRSVKFAIVTRTQTRENSPVSPAQLNLWEAETGKEAAAPSMLLNEEGRRFRYRVYSTTVPLRNLIWSNKPAP